MLEYKTVKLRIIDLELLIDCYEMRVLCQSTCEEDGQAKKQSQRILDQLKKAK